MRLRLQAEDAASAFSTLDGEDDDKGYTKTDGHTDTCRYKLQCSLEAGEVAIAVPVRAVTRECDQTAVAQAGRELEHDTRDLRAHEHPISTEYSQR